MCIIIELPEVFICPIFKSETKNVLVADFGHIHELYDLEHGKYPKMAHKLSDKMLKPKSIEKTNVKLADAAFHESTINALNYYGENGYPHFIQTAAFIKIIRDWFNTVNVKSKDAGVKRRDELRYPISKEDSQNQLTYLTDMGDWLEEWKREHGPKY